MNDTGTKRRGRAREAFVTGMAYLRLDAVDELSYPLAVALKELAVIFPVLLYFFIAELVPGGAAGESSDVGGDYFTFTVIGLATAGLLQAALGGFGARLQGAQDQGTFETLLVEPIPWVMIPFALNLWRIALGAINSLLILLVGWILGANYALSGLPAFLVFQILGMFAAMAVGILAASLMVLAKRSHPVLALYGLAASLLGGALFPITLLPGWLRAFSYAVPHAYVIDLARQSLQASPPAPVIPATNAVIILLLFIAVAFIAGLFAFSRSLQYARKMGLLSGY